MAVATSASLAIQESLSYPYSLSFSFRAYLPEQFFHKLARCEAFKHGGRGKVDFVFFQFDFDFRFHIQSRPNAPVGVLRAVAVQRAARVDIPRVVRMAGVRG